MQVGRFDAAQEYMREIGSDHEAYETIHQTCTAQVRE